MATTILKPSWIIPVIPDNTVYDHHVIVLTNDTIEGIYPSDSPLLPKDADAQVIDLPDHVITPGLINMHTHSPMALFRGLGDDLPFMTWLQDYIWPAEKKCISPEFIADGTELAMAEMLKSGTTCFNEHYFLPDIIAETAHKAGMRTNIGLFTGDVAVADGNNVDEQLETAKRVLESHSALSPLVSFSMAPHSPYLLNDEGMIKTRDFANHHNLRLHMHVHEPLHELEQSEALYQMRPLNRLKQLGLLSNRLQCVHMTRITDEDIKLVKEAGAHVVTCPHSNMKLCSGFTPIHRFVEAGINVTIGTDGACSNNDLDLLAEMQTAALLAKNLSEDPTMIPANQALAMATINGAIALGIEDRVGSIEAGKQADLVAFDLSQVNTQPVYNPLSQLVYAAAQHQVTHVWVAGRCLLKQRNLITINEQAMLAKTKNWRERIIASLEL